MGGEKRQELLDVARIGFDRFSRHPPLAAELPPPPLDRVPEVGGGVDEGGFGLGNSHVPISQRRTVKKELTASVRQRICVAFPSVSPGVPWSSLERLAKRFQPFHLRPEGIPFGTSTTPEPRDT